METWMDYSGAPAMLIPVRVLCHWTGVNTPDWIDYERACALAWPGKGVIEIGGTTGYVLYSESDTHAWLSSFKIYASGGYIPSEMELNSAQWEDTVRWKALERHYILANSAEDLTGGLVRVKHQVVELEVGDYFVDYAEIIGTSYGQFHRFRLGAEV